MLELHHYPPSTTSIKVRLCLAEKGLSFVEKVVDLARFEHLEPGYQSINPRSVVPTLVHDGCVVTDSSVINEYLDEAFPAPPRMPSDPRLRAQVRAWIRWVDDVPTVAVQSPTFVAFLGPAIADRPREEVEAAIARIPDPQTRARWLRLVAGKIGRAEIDEAYRTMETALDRLEAALEDRPWIVGDRYTLADLATTPVVVRLEHLGRSDLWEGKRPRVASWLERVRQRPSFPAAYAFLGSSQATGTAPSGSRHEPDPPDRKETVP